MKVETIALISSIITTLLLLLLGSQGILLKPLFSVEAKPDFDLNQTSIDLKNYGFAQAKNAIAQLVFTKAPQLIKNQCYEGIISSQENNTIKINFSRFSTSVNCELTFRGSALNYIDSIVITADDSNGFVWNPIQALYFQITLSQIGIWVAIITLMISIASAIAVPFQRRIRKRKEEISRTSETEISNDIKTTQQELDSLEQSLGTTTDPSLRDHIRQRMRSLDNKIRELYSELDELRSKRKIEGKSENLVGEFFLNWGELEQELVRYSDKLDINSIRIGSSALIREFLRREALSKTFVNNFNQVRKFRNELARGILIPTKELLEKNIQSLKKLLEEIKQINPTDQ